MPIESCIGKKYKLATSENFDEFMKALGVGLVTRKLGNAVSPVVELTQKGDQFSLSSSSTFKNTVITFKLGEEFDQVTPDGRNVKTVVTKQGADTLVEIQKGDNKESKIVREFTDKEIKMVLSVGDIVCKRVYQVVG